MPVPQTIPTLQSALVDLIDLSLLAKQLHWNVYGPQFRSVHLELDEVIDQLRIWADDVAERAAAVGGAPDGRTQTVSATTRVGVVEPGRIETEKAVALFTERLEQTARRIEATLHDLDEDLPSQDILIGVVQGIDKATWMFRVQTQ